MPAEGTAALRGPALLPRVATALIGAPLLLGAAWLGGFWWLGVLAVVSAGGAVEFARLYPLGAGGRAVILGSLAVVAAAVWMPSSGLTWLIGAWAVVVLVAGIGPRLLAAPAPQTPWVRHPWTSIILGALYLGLPMGVLARWRWDGSFAVLGWFFIIIWANDIAAYFAGLAVGRHKLAPRTSPGKSWEGAFAGLIAGALAGAGAGPVFGLTAAAGAIVGAALTVVSQVGDLLESAMKRRAGTKDSGALLPGHGGFLDRFDGVLLAAPVGYVLVRIWT